MGELFIACFFSVVGIGPRLSGFFTEITETGVVTIDDIRNFLPIDHQQSIQLCAFPLHNNKTSSFDVAKRPVNLIMAEYGFKVLADKHIKLIMVEHGS